MSSLFTRVVANDVYQKNINSLNASKSNAKSYLDVEIQSFNQGRDDLNKISSYHNKISSAQNKTEKNIDAIDRLISELIFDVSLVNDRLLSQTFLEQPLVVTSVTEIVSKWKGINHTNLSLANRQLFHGLFLFFRNAIKRDALNDLYSACFKVLDYSDSSETLELAKIIIEKENSALKGVSSLAPPSGIDKGEFGNYLYDEPYSLALNAYNTDNSLSYLFESEPLSVCSFYNKVLSLYLGSNEFEFTPDSLLEIYHPAIKYKSSASSLFCHSTESIEPIHGTPKYFIDSAISRHIYGVKAINTILSGDLPCKKQQIEKPTHQITPY
jgi:hypothetical protein